METPLVSVRGSESVPSTVGGPQMLLLPHFKAPVPASMEQRQEPSAHLFIAARSHASSNGRRLVAKEEARRDDFAARV